MTSIYGARSFGIVDQLMEWLMEKSPGFEIEQWDREYVMPARYLTQKLNVVIAHRLKSCVSVEAWLRSVSKTCLKQQQRVRFTTPMGFPIALGVEQETRQRVKTEINGSKRWETREAMVTPGELSARATNRGITANVIHAFDASFCHAVVQTMQRSGLPVITNHDCFATLPSAAADLRRNLLFELREHYKPDWLTEIKEEIEENAGIALLPPPFVGDLCEGEIGNNPYVFS
jgi:DNA-directed RNA polymerase